MKIALPFAVVTCLWGCTTASDPATTPAADVGVDSPVVEECPSPTGAGTQHTGTTISADETWTAAGSPHVLTFDQQVTKGATLTIEPCAVVRVKGGYKLVVDSGAKLVAAGTASKPIRFMPDDPSAPWGHLGAFGPSTMRLAYVTVEGAGAESSGGLGAIEVRGDQALAMQELLAVDHVTVKGSASAGVSLRSGAGFTKTSTDLVVTGAKKAAIRLPPRLASTLPTGAFTGNAEDLFAVETEAGGDITLEDVVFHDRGVPYRIGSALTNGELKVAGDRTLTLEPGVTLRFEKNEAAGLFVDSGTTTDPARGSLVAVGTAAKPIVFTGTSAVAGSWRGLVFGNQPTAKNRLEYVRIEYAGGVSRANSFHCDPAGGGAFSKNEDAALTVFGPPPAGMLKNSTLSDSAGLGVNLAYSGTAVDLMPTNTFTRLASCKQSTPRSSTGACPTTVACP